VLRTTSHRTASKSPESPAYSGRYLALWLLLAGALIGFAAYEFDHTRRQALENGRVEAENLSRITSEHMGLVLDGIDRTLTLFKVAHERKLFPAPMSTLSDAMKLQQETGPERRATCSIVTGGLVASTDPDAGGTSISIADRDYFHEHTHARI